MRCALRLFGVAVCLAACGWWVAAGASWGWWRTRVGTERIDEITGLSVLEWQDRFVPGLETPALGLLLGGALWGATFLFRRTLPPQSKPQ